MNLQVINDLTEENRRVYLSNRQLLEIIFSIMGIHSKIPHVEEEIPYISSNCDMINRILSLLTFLKIEDEQIDDLIDDLNMLKDDPQVVPTCLRIDNIKVQSLFARYRPLRDYSFLERNFHHVFRLITPLTDSPVNLGVFLITVEENITFVKATWNDERDRDNYKTFLDMKSYKKMMKDATFNAFMKLYIVKIVQDRFVMGNFRGTFSVMLDLFLDRGIEVSDHFHQDQAEKMEVGYFTLTYLMPKERIILGASLLVTQNSAVSVPVTNMTTLGVFNELYHSTPACCTSRQYSWTNPKTKKRRSSSFSNSHRKAKIERVSRKRQVVNEVIELFPAELPILDSTSHMKQLLTDTRNTRRTFMRTLYTDLQTPDHVSSVEVINISLTKLLEETFVVERTEMLDYVVG